MRCSSWCSACCQSTCRTTTSERRKWTSLSKPLLNHRPLRRWSRLPKCRRSRPRPRSQKRRSCHPPVQRHRRHLQVQTRQRNLRRLPKKSKTLAISTSPTTTATRVGRSRAVPASPARGRSEMSGQASSQIVLCAARRAASSMVSAQRLRHPRQSRSPISAGQPTRQAD